MACLSMLPQVARRLEGKVALITGGANGIGASTARLFAKHGAKVIIADIDDNNGKSLCSEIGSGSASYVHCDVSHEPDVRLAVEAAVAFGDGRLDILFSNAGTVGPNTGVCVMDSTKPAFDEVMGVNLVGSYLAAKHAAKFMIPTHSGSIIIMSSVTSVVPGVTSVEYTSSRHANVGLMKSLAVELGQHGVRVNCVSPYGLISATAEREFGKEGNNLEEHMEQHAVLKGHRLKQEDVANGVLFLASDESKYVSGLNMLIDGAYSVASPSHHIPTKP